MFTEDLLKLNCALSKKKSIEREYLIAEIDRFIKIQRQLNSHERNVTNTRSCYDRNNLNLISKLFDNLQHFRNQSC